MARQTGQNISHEEHGVDESMVAVVIKYTSRINHILIQPLRKNTPGTGTQNIPPW